MAREVVNLNLRTIPLDDVETAVWCPTCRSPSAQTTHHVQALITDDDRTLHTYVVRSTYCLSCAQIIALEGHTVE